MQIHFAGVGGIGVSALAQYFIAQGQEVSGSDSVISDIVLNLEKLGLKIIPEDGELAANCELLIYSEAIEANSKLRKIAHERQIPSLSYAQALGAISRKHPTIGICGTHGKSTCTAMLGIALQEAQQDPLVIVGTKVREFQNSNFRLSQKSDAWFVVEACEYRGSFLNLSPQGLIITNCEYDHPDYYPDFESYKQAFRQMMGKVPADGFIVINQNDETLVELSQNLTCKVILVDAEKDPIIPQVPGQHNILNTALVAAAAQEIAPAKNSSIRESLKNFRGTWRRFEILGEKNDSIFIDDYAHHPTEIKATLEALLAYRPDLDFTIVYQAHQYARTLALFADFIQAFKTIKNHPHQIYITDIYAARDTEADQKLTSGEDLAQKLKEQGLNAQYSGNYQQSAEMILAQLNHPQIVMSMGAGPINQVLEEILKKY